MIKRTCLYSEHLKLGAKIISFSGFEMPVSYGKGILHEYNSIRSKCGIFDISHMGQFFINGNRAQDFLQKTTINDVSKLNNYEAQYSAMCNPNGGIIDDLILYKKPNGYLMVVNAGNIEKNFKWLNDNIIENVIIQNNSSEISSVAIQGPKTREVLSKITSTNLNINFYSYTDAVLSNRNIMLSRTGYTGELGFEIYGSHNDIRNIWIELINLGVEPCGLASRDILRMEMKYCLYGNDIDETKSPIEAGLSWITALNKKFFIGQDKLINLETKSKLIAFKMLDKGIPRKDYTIEVEGMEAGYVTSGTQSFLLKAGIGLGYIKNKNSKAGQHIDIIIRNKQVRAEIIKPPFIKNTSLLK